MNKLIILETLFLLTAAISTLNAQEVKVEHKLIDVQIDDTFHKKLAVQFAITNPNSFPLFCEDISLIDVNYVDRAGKLIAVENAIASKVRIPANAKDFFVLQDLETLKDLLAENENLSIDLKDAELSLSPPKKVQNQSQMIYLRNNRKACGENETVLVPLRINPKTAAIKATAPPSRLPESDISRDALIFHPSNKIAYHIQAASDLALKAYLIDSKTGAINTQGGGINLLSKNPEAKVLNHLFSKDGERLFIIISRHQEMPLFKAGVDSPATNTTIIKSPLKLVSVKLNPEIYSVEKVETIGMASFYGLNGNANAYFYYNHVMQVYNIVHTPSHAHITMGMNAGPPKPFLDPAEIPKILPPIPIYKTPVGSRANFFRFKEDSNRAFGLKPLNFEIKKPPENSNPFFGNAFATKASSDEIMIPIPEPAGAHQEHVQSFRAGMPQYNATRLSQNGFIFVAKKAGKIRSRVDVLNQQNFLRVGRYEEDLCDVEAIYAAASPSFQKDYSHIDAQDPMGFTRFHYYLLKGEIQKAKDLYLKGANPNIKTKRGVSPLATCLMNDQLLDILDLLLADEKVDKVSPDQLGMRPIHVAIGGVPHLKAFNQLVQLGDNLHCEFGLDYGEHPRMNLLDFVAESKKSHERSISYVQMNIERLKLLTEEQIKQQAGENAAALEYLRQHQKMLNEHPKKRIKQLEMLEPELAKRKQAVQSLQQMEEKLESLGLKPNRQ